MDLKLIYATTTLNSRGRPLGLSIVSDRAKALSLHFAIVFNLAFGILILFDIWCL